jgi:O-methyltransferase involved in polyketide biosynthesis
MPMDNNFSGIEWTLVLPLLSRARITAMYPDLFNDPRSIEIIERLSGPLKKINDPRIVFGDLGNATRARVLDDAIKTYIHEHPKATIVNLGAGFDDAFSRVDNGYITWFDIDLQDVIEMRKHLIPETDRSHCVTCSILDSGWMKEIIPRDHGLLFIAGGLICYFSKDEVKHLIISLADRFPHSEFVFDGVSRLGRFWSNWRIKSAGIHSVKIKWFVNSRTDFKKWNSQISVVERYPLFAHIERSPNFDKRMVRIMNRSDKLWNLSIVHLRFGI